VPGVFNTGGDSSPSSASTGRKYTLSISMSVRNLLNHTNPGPIIGNITSPFVWTGKSTGWSRRVWFSEAANDRRLELQTRLTF
jgi:hypothetical protein